MAFNKITIGRRLKLAGMCLILALGGSFYPTALAADKPVLWYNLYYHAKGDDRYLDTTDYGEVLRRLEEIFTVKVSWEQPTPQRLEGVDLLFISTTNDKAIGGNPPPAHMSAEDIEAITWFVKYGGGLIFFSNQDGNHNVEKEASNRLLSRFGLEATHVNIGAKRLVIPRSTPLIGGLRWGAYGMPTFHLHEPLPLRSAVVVMNDLQQDPIDPQGRDYRGAVMVWGQYGRGRLVAVADSGWVSEWALKGEGIGNVAIEAQDNWEIMRRLARWAAKLP